MSLLDIEFLSVTQIYIKDLEQKKSTTDFAFILGLNLECDHYINTVLFLINMVFFLRIPRLKSNYNYNSYCITLIQKIYLFIPSYIIKIDFLLRKSDELSKIILYTKKLSYEHFSAAF